MEPVLQARSWLPRTEGSLRLAFRRRGEQTVLDVLHPRRARPAHAFPAGRRPVSRGGPAQYSRRPDWRRPPRSRRWLWRRVPYSRDRTAAEKIYRARDGEATIRLDIALEAGADLAWLPQATILFDAACLDRRTEVHLAADARFLAVEMLVFGRAAMGEDVHRGFCRDAWRVWRDGKLVLADTLRVDGTIAATLDRRAVLGGGRATAFVV